MSETDQVSPFFTLPLELREEIYKRVLSHGLNILRACHEIEVEARKFVYQQPLVFRSQKAFYTWVEQSPYELLVHVSQVSVHIQDTDLTPILENTSVGRSSPTQLQTLELYRVEVGRFEQALKEVPKVKTITLRALSYQPSFLYRQYVGQILDVLGSSCPNLLDLRLEGSFHNQELQFLRTLENLESFSFDGFSLSSPRTIVKVLSNLHQLRNLSLVSDRTLLAPDTGLHSNFTAKRQSFTGEVVRTIKQLASFSVIEQASTTSPTLFFTSEVLSSLHNHRTLETISIRLSHTPEKATLCSLEEFLEKTTIKRLELDWPDLHSEVLEQYHMLGNTLETLWVRAKSAEDAFDILWSVFESRYNGDLMNLRKVVLVRSSCGYEVSQYEACVKDNRNMGLTALEVHDGSPSLDDQDNVNIVRAKGRLRELGIHVAWCTEDS